MHGGLRVCEKGKGRGVVAGGDGGPGVAWVTGMARLGVWLAGPQGAGMAVGPPPPSRTKRQAGEPKGSAWGTTVRLAPRLWRWSPLP